MGRKDTPIRYTSRDYESIKNDLIDYAKRYYASTFKDFNEASFGAQMIDAVAYIGDILSFYTDYQANEAFLDTAMEYNNVVRQARQLGYKFKYSASSMGDVDVFLSIPATTDGAGLDTQYLPTLQAGTLFGAGSNTFTLLEDIDFSNQAAIEVVVSAVNSATGVPTTYAVKAKGRVISGVLKFTSYVIGNFKKFRSIQISDGTITDVLSVTDSEGHQYMEVENLSQDIIYRPILSQRDDKNLAPYLLRPYVVPRRYTLEKFKGGAILQFGHGSDVEIKNPAVADPSNVILDVYGKDYISSLSFDPSRLNSTDKFGIAPANTTLYVSYRSNDSTNANAAVNTVNRVLRPNLQFTNEGELDGAKVNTVISSVEVTNESPIIGDVTLPTIDELKIRAKAHFAKQNRAVTKQDYISAVYSMPAKFGAIKRVNIIQDVDSFKRNLNMYVIAQNTDNTLVAPTRTIKENITTWLANYKMVNDTIDILDANIVNIGINFDIIGDAGVNSLDLLLECKRQLGLLYASVFNIGEPLDIAQIYKTLNRIDGVVDTTNVDVIQKVGLNYSNIFLDIENHVSTDGRLLMVPADTILELKYPGSDITGQITGIIADTAGGDSSGGGAY